jgi:5'-deoxynucleotidase YfbR-like HD superfamily hydrolase
MAVEVPKFQPLEFPGVPGDIDYRYSRGMDSVHRWEGSLTPSTMKESNLDHMRGMFELLDEIVETHPAIVTNMDLDAVRKMIYVHDAGELITGDLVLSRPDHAIVRDDWKRREEEGFHRLVERFVRKRYPQLADEAVHYYNRYVHYEPNDKEAVFTHLLDKVQAVRFGNKYVYSSEYAWGKSEAHSSLGLDKFNFFADSLRAIMDDEEADSLNVFVEGEIDNFFASLRNNSIERWRSQDPRSHSSTK